MVSHRMKRMIIKPRYFEDGREYEFVTDGSSDGSVTVTMFHDPRDLMEEVFGFVLSAQEASDMGRALLEAVDFACASRKCDSESTSKSK